MDLSLEIKTQASRILFRLDGQNPNCSGRGFELKCADNNSVVEIMSQQYLVLRLNLDQILTVVRKDIVDDDGCPHKLVNTTLNGTLFDYSPATSENLTFLYNCTNGVPPWVASGSACPNGFYLEQRDSEDGEKINQIRSCRSRVEIWGASDLLTNVYITGQQRSLIACARQKVHISFLDLILKSLDMHVFEYYSMNA